MHLARLAVFLLGPVLPVCAAVRVPIPVPQAPVETLTGRKLELSRDIGPRLAVLIIGFTKASRGQASEWAQRLEPELAATPGAQLYEVGVIADVPRLLRGFVVGRIRANVPKKMHDHFLLVLEHPEVWKQLADLDDKDSAYVVLMNRGAVAWRGRGKLTEAGCRSLLQALRDSAESEDVGK
jgi:hypothetical protein